MMRRGRIAVLSGAVVALMPNIAAMTQGGDPRNAPTSAVDAYRTENIAAAPASSFQPGLASDARTYSFDRYLGRPILAGVYPAEAPLQPLKIVPMPSVGAHDYGQYFNETYLLGLDKPVPRALVPESSRGRPVPSMPGI